jgi:SAM-dependent methyltransferase
VTVGSGADAYLFSSAWERERARLTALEAIYDPITVPHLTALGVGPGWRCLEVGGGAGSIARWLAAAGASVRATDVDVRFLEDARAARVEALRHDVRTDPIEEGAFDLVHARALLEHLAERDQVIPRLVSALRPGGVLLVEDLTFGGATATAFEASAVPPELGPLVTTVQNAVAAGYRAIGADPQFGVRLPGCLVAAGLAEVEASVCIPLVRGGTRAAEFYLLGMEQVGPRLITAGLCSAEDLDRTAAHFRDPEARWPSLALVSAWGRRLAA